MATANLPAAFFGDNFGVKSNDLEKVLDTALAKKADYADLYFEYRQNEGVSLEEGLVKNCSQSTANGVGVRVLEGGSDSFVQLVGEQVTRENLLKTLDSVQRLVTYNGRSIPDKVKGYTGFDFPVIAAQLGNRVGELDRLAIPELVLRVDAELVEGGLLHRPRERVGDHPRLLGRPARVAGQRLAQHPLRERPPRLAPRARDDRDGDDARCRRGQGDIARVEATRGPRGPRPHSPIRRIAMRSSTRPVCCRRSNT